MCSLWTAYCIWKCGFDFFHSFFFFLIMFHYALWAVHASQLIFFLIKIPLVIVGDPASALLVPWCCVGTSPGVAQLSPVPSCQRCSQWPDTWLVSPGCNLKVEGCAPPAPAASSLLSSGRDVSAGKEWWQQVTFYRSKVKQGDRNCPAVGYH